MLSYFFLFIFYNTLSDYYKHVAQNCEVLSGLQRMNDISLHLIVESQCEQQNITNVVHTNTRENKKNINE